MLTDIAKTAEEGSVMRSSSLIRRRGDQRRNRRHAAVGVLAAVGVGAIVATSSLYGMDRTANDLPATPPSATASPTATATPTAIASSPSAGEPTKPATERSAPPATATRLGVTITGPSPNLVMSLGGKEVDFTVTITNLTGHTFSKIKPLVYVGKCACTDRPVPVGPAGTMKVKQPDGNWKPVDYGREGGGMDYVGAEQVPAFTLASGATRSFTYRIGFSAAQTARYHDGDLQLGVMMLAMSGYTAVGPTQSVGRGITILGRDASPLDFVPIHLTTD